MKIATFNIPLAALLTIIAAASAFAQTTEFSYQGFVTDNNAPANGVYDFEFRLFENLNGGVAVAVQPRPAVPVTNGVFNVVLDFGAFPPANRFLEIGLRPAGAGAFTTLAPRSKILATPYATAALNALNAANATNATNATNAATATNATNALQLGGVAAGQFVQTNDVRLSDARNPLPNSNNYIRNTSTAQSPANFNITGNGTVLGTLTGGTVSATTQFNLGPLRYIANNGDSRNTFIGTNSGIATTGISNTYVGSTSGDVTTTGDFNVFLGVGAGNTNVTGSKNTLVGTFSDVGGGALENANAIGYQALAETSNSLVLGSVQGRNGGQSDTSVGIGTTAPEAPLDVASQLAGATNFRLTNYGGRTVFRTRSAPGTRATPSATQLNDILFELQTDGYTGTAFTAQGRAKILVRATENWTSTANGAAMDFFTTANGTTGTQQRMVITNDGNVGIGRSVVDARLDVNGDVRLGATGGTTGCVQDRDGTVIAGTCASDRRYKKDINSFGRVLDDFARLRPVTYFWRASEFAGQRFGTKQSFGLIAQEVEPLFPELVTTDERGFKAINYSRLPLLTIQAVKELKARNDALERGLAAQRRELDELKRLVTRRMRAEKTSVRRQTHPRAVRRR